MSMPSYEESLEIPAGRSGSLAELEWTGKVTQNEMGTPSSSSSSSTVIYSAPIIQLDHRCITTVRS